MTVDGNHEQRCKQKRWLTQLKPGFWVTPTRRNFWGTWGNNRFKWREVTTSIVSVCTTKQNTFINSFKSWLEWVSRRICEPGFLQAEWPSCQPMKCHCTEGNNYINSQTSVLWRCWLGGRKGIQPVKTEWWGYRSGARCKWFAYGPADANATPSSLSPVKIRMVYLSGVGLPRLSWKKKAIKWM